MTPSRARKTRGISAWLITWESVSDHAKPTDVVAAVLNPRLSGRRVLEIVELLYANASYDTSERIAFVKSPQRNPYRAQFGKLHDGVPWEGEIICGHNPWLEARLVSNLRAERDADGLEQFVWEERPRPAPA